MPQSRSPPHLIEPTPPDPPAMKPPIEDAVYTGVEQFGGSFSAEHGVGTEKRRAYLAYGNAARRAVAQAIKAALDPKNLFNPGKVPFRAD